MRQPKVIKEGNDYTGIIEDQKKVYYYKNVVTTAVLVIKKIQWAAHSDMDGRNYCPICKGYKPSHKKNCIVASLIRENK